jgi:hypothetical protein
MTRPDTIRFPSLPKGRGRGDANRFPAWPRKGREWTRMRIGGCSCPIAGLRRPPGRARNHAEALRSGARPDARVTAVAGIRSKQRTMSPVGVSCFAGDRWLRGPGVGQEPGPADVQTIGAGLEGWSWLIIGILLLEVA